VRVLIIHAWAGLPERQFEYAALQRLTGWDVHLLVPTRWRDEYGHDITPRPLPDFADRYHTARLALAGNIPLHTITSRIAPLLSALSPDLIYVYHEPYGVTTFQVALANQSSIKAPIGFHSSQNICKRYPPPFRWMERAVFSWCSFATVLAPSVTDVLRSKGFDKRIEVVPWGIDTKQFSPNLAEGGGPPRPLRVGFVGRVVPQKGIDTILEAFARVEHDDMTLTVVGSGPSRAELEDYAARLDVASRVTWRGYVEPRALPAVYRQFDVVVVPSRTTASWKEQFGRVVIEAAACGVAVIASDSGELPQVVEAAADGRTFSEGNPDALADALDALAADDTALQSAKRAARENTAKNFSIERSLEHLVAALTAAAA